MWAGNVIHVLSLGILTCLLLSSFSEAGRSGGSGSRSSSSSRSSGSRTSSRTSYGSSSSSGSSRGSYSSSGSSHHSSSRASYSSSSSYGSYSSHGSSSYGSSAPSGYQKTSAFGRSWASAASDYSGSSKNWHAGPSAVKTESNRPSVSYRRPEYYRPVAPVYNNHITVINSPSRGYYGSNTDGLVTGYFLGKMMSSSHHPGGYGYGYHSYPYYYDSYVPYRYRYSSNSATGDTGATSTSPPANFMATNIASQQVDVCTLARWNMELPYTELPNMMLASLSDDNISGSNLTGKSQFLHELLDTAMNNYGWFNETANLFEIDQAKDLSLCNFAMPRMRPEWTTSTTTTTTTTTTTLGPENIVNYFNNLLYGGGRKTEHADAAANRARWESYRDNHICKDEIVRKTNCECTNSCHLRRGTTRKPLPSEEPFLTGAKRIMQIYSSQSADQELLKDLVQSAKNCFGSQENPKNLSKSYFPCLDYSIDVKQFMNHNMDIWRYHKKESIFGDGEICQKYFAPPIKNCTEGNSAFECSVADIININVFARNFYLCKDPVDSAVLSQVESMYPAVPQSYSYGDNGCNTRKSGYTLLFVIFLRVLITRREI